MFSLPTFTKSMIMMLFVSQGTNAFLFKQINTGERGIRKVQGEIQPIVLKPGWYTYTPYYSEILTIDIKQDTDVFHNIPCGSLGGNDLMFNNVQITNKPSRQDAHIIRLIEEFTIDYEVRLIENIIKKVVMDTCETMTQDEIYRKDFQIFDERIKEGLTKFQKDHNTNLEIIEVYVPKPEIKKKFKDLYDKQTEELKLIENQKTIQERVLQEKLTLKMSAEQDEIRAKAVSEIQKDKKKMEAEKEKSIQAIKDNKEAQSIKTAADAKAYELRTIAAAEKERLTPEFLQSEYNRNVVANAAAYYGPNLPKFVLQTSQTQPSEMEKEINRQVMDDL